MGDTLRSFVGGGYDAFWTFRGRYRVVKGSRASKKSKTTALWYMSQLSKEKYREANLLVVRKTFRTLKDSCFTELKWAIRQLGLTRDWKARLNPLEIENVKTGQKIYFRGLDDPLKATSITVEQGYLCWLWVEEAYEIENEADFDTLDETIRGQVPPPLFKQATVTFNPWSEHHWLKKRFFDRRDPEVLSLTTDYTCNEWLDDADARMFERMKRDNPRRYRVAGLGEWGVSEGMVYERWSLGTFDLPSLLSGDEGWKWQCIYGLDYGYSNDPTAFVAAAVNPVDRVLYVFDEHYQTRMVNSEIAAMITEKGYAKERIYADAAEPKSNEELRRAGVPRIRAAEKGKDSILHGIAQLQEYRMIVHPRCQNTVKELSAYAWQTDENGNGINRPVDNHNHLMDALRYAMSQVRFFRPEPPPDRRESSVKTEATRPKRDRSTFTEWKGGWNG